jgi:hypothetical protein
VVIPVVRGRLRRYQTLVPRPRIPATLAALQEAFSREQARQCDDLLEQSSAPLIGKSLNHTRRTMLVYEASSVLQQCTLAPQTSDPFAATFFLKAKASAASDSAVRTPS